MTWEEIIESEKEKPYFSDLMKKIDEEYRINTCYPPYEKIFKAFELTPYEKVKCVILGQDPYHEPNQAVGLSFSVEKGVLIPRSLKNIYKELHEEFGYNIPDHGNLTKWAEQGVLLLNSVLTVRKHYAASHQNLGWETFTDNILKHISRKESPVIYMLWGSFARSKARLISENPNHLILEAPHPSPFSARTGFFGCGHFRKCNEFLTRNGVSTIDWQIDNDK